MRETYRLAWRISGKRRLAEESLQSANEILLTTQTKVKGGAGNLRSYSAAFAQSPSRSFKESFPIAIEVNSAIKQLKKTGADNIAPEILKINIEVMIGHAASKPNVHDVEIPKDFTDDTLIINLAKKAIWLSAARALPSTIDKNLYIISHSRLSTVLEQIIHKQQNGTDHAMITLTPNESSWRNRWRSTVWIFSTDKQYKKLRTSVIWEVLSVKMAVLICPARPGPMKTRAARHVYWVVPDGTFDISVSISMGGSLETSLNENIERCSVVLIFRTFCLLNSYIEYTTRTGPHYVFHLYVAYHVGFRFSFPQSIHFVTMTGKRLVFFSHLYRR